MYIGLWCCVVLWCVVGILSLTCRQMCRAEELEEMVCGSSELDFEDLQHVAMYLEGYHKKHPLIKYVYVLQGFSLFLLFFLLLFCSLFVLFVFFFILFVVNT